MGLFGFILFESPSASCIWTSVSFFKFWKFLTIISSNTSSGTPITWILICSMLVFFFFFFFDHTAHGVWDLFSRTRDQTHVPALEVKGLNQWTTREVPVWCCSGGSSNWSHFKNSFFMLLFWLGEFLHKWASRSLVHSSISPTLLLIPFYFIYCVLQLWLVLFYIF